MHRLNIFETLKVHQSFQLQHLGFCDEQTNNLDFKKARPIHVGNKIALYVGLSLDATDEKMELGSASDVTKI